MKGYLQRLARVSLLCLLLCLGLPAIAHASPQASSTNYSVDNVFFGSGGSLNSCSTNYCSKQSAGETAVGNSKSSNYQIQAGNNTDRSESLQLLITSNNVDLGTVSTNTTGTGTASFSVKSYLASGYAVQISGTPPKYSSYTVAAMSSPAASSPGTEQFGINLAANNSCGGVVNGNGGTITGSSAAVQNPSGFGYGAAAHNSSTDYYDTACKFMYVNGDVIASSSSSSGETDYTISYIFNASIATRGGTYSTTQTIIATSTF